MKLECEGQPAILDADEEQVAKRIRKLRNCGPCSFASLTDAEGNSIHVVGGGATCMVERFVVSAAKRFRAFQARPNPVFPDGTILAYAAGEIRMKSDEWLLSETVAELFLCFLRSRPYPQRVSWRIAPD
jgi:hypothetical protein